MTEDARPRAILPPRPAPPPPKASCTPSHLASCAPSHHASCIPSYLASCTPSHLASCAPFPPLPSAAAAPHSQPALHECSRYLGCIAKRGSGSVFDPGSFIIVSQPPQAQQAPQSSTRCLECSAEQGGGTRAGRRRTTLSWASQG